MRNLRIFALALLCGCSFAQTNLNNFTGTNAPLVTTAIPSSDQLTAAGTFATTLSVNTTFKAGTIVKIYANGIYTTTATASPQAIFQVNAGGTAGICNAPSAITLGTGVSNGVWNLECSIQINTTGASGTAKALGHYELANNVNGAEVIGNNRLFPNSATATFNTTAAQTVSIQETGVLVAGQTFNLQAIWAEVVGP